MSVVNTAVKDIWRTSLGVYVVLPEIKAQVSGLRYVETYERYADLPQNTRNIYWRGRCREVHVQTYCSAIQSAIGFSKRKDSGRQWSRVYCSSTAPTVMSGASTISDVSVTKLRCVSIGALASLDVPESFPGVRVPGNCAILGRLSFRYCMKWNEHECTIRKEPSVESHKAQKLSELLASDRFRK